MSDPVSFPNLKIMKTLFLVLFVLLSTSIFSQNSSQYDNIMLTTANEYRNAEPQVMLAADYVYSTPIDKDNLNRKNSISFIMKWMGGTSDFSFIMDATVMKIVNNDRDVMGIYSACLAKYALQQGKGVDRDSLKYNSYLLLANYCEDPGNNYKPKGEIKKLIEAKNQHKLQEYLDSKQK